MFKLRSSIKRKTEELGKKHSWQKAEQGQRSWGRTELSMWGVVLTQREEHLALTVGKGKVKESFPSWPLQPESFSCLDHKGFPPEKECSDEILSPPIPPHTCLSDSTLRASLPTYFRSLRHNYGGLGGKKQKKPLLLLLYKRKRHFSSAAT